MFKSAFKLYKQFSYSLFNWWNFGVFSSREFDLIFHGITKCLSFEALTNKPYQSFFGKPVLNLLASPYNDKDTLIVIVGSDGVSYISWKRDLLNNKNKHPDLSYYVAQYVHGNLSVIREMPSLDHLQKQIGFVVPHKGGLSRTEAMIDPFDPSSKLPPWLLPPLDDEKQDQNLDKE